MSGRKEMRRKERKKENGMEKSTIRNRDKKKTQFHDIQQTAKKRERKRRKEDRVGTKVCFCLLDHNHSRGKCTSASKR